VRSSESAGGNGALHAVAQAYADGLSQSIREMQAQRRDVDRKHVEIATRIAALVGSAKKD
jgi:hypothetical protein